MCYGQIIADKLIGAARKLHTCSWCCEAIQAGESYQRQRARSDGIQTTKYHPECYDAMKRDEGVALDCVLPQGARRGMTEDETESYDMGRATEGET